MSQAIRTDDSIESNTRRGNRSVDIKRTDIHEVLSNERRIALLDLLQEESPRELSAIAEEIAAAETGERPPPRNIRQSVYVTLHQTHLPKLDDLGIVAYDAREKVVARDAYADLVYDTDSETEDESLDGGVEAYFGLAVAGLLASLASVGGVGPFTAVPVSSYALGTLVALLVAFAYRMGRDGSSITPRLREKLT